MLIVLVTFVALKTRLKSTGSRINNERETEAAVCIVSPSRLRDMKLKHRNNERYTHTHTHTGVYTHTQTDIWRDSELITLLRRSNDYL